MPISKHNKPYKSHNTWRRRRNCFKDYIRRVERTRRDADNISALNPYQL